MLASHATEPMKRHHVVRSGSGAGWPASTFLQSPEHHRGTAYVFAPGPFSPRTGTARRHARPGPGPKGRIDVRSEPDACDGFRVRALEQGWRPLAGRPRHGRHPLHRARRRHRLRRDRDRFDRLAAGSLALPARQMATRFDRGRHGDGRPRHPPLAAYASVDGESLHPNRSWAPVFFPVQDGDVARARVVAQRSSTPPLRAGTFKSRRAALG